MKKDHIFSFAIGIALGLIVLFLMSLSQPDNVQIKNYPIYKLGDKVPISINISKEAEYCNLTVNYPNKTVFIDQLMSKSKNGTKHTYVIVSPRDRNATGVYLVSITCIVDDREIHTTSEFRVERYGDLVKKEGRLRL